MSARGRTPPRRWLVRACTTVAVLLLAVAAAPHAWAQQQVNVEEAIQGARLRLENNSGNRELRVYLVRLYFVQGARAVEAENGAAALSSFMEGRRVAQGGLLPLEESDETLRAMDSALARAVLKLGKDPQALAQLEGMIASTPGLSGARYALGAVLMRSAAPEHFGRGMEMLGALRSDSDPDLQRRAVASGAGLAYERALADFRAGRPGAAREALEAARRHFGERPFQTDAQNQNLRYALAKALDDTGDTAGALREYEALHAENAAFALPGGAPLRRMLADAYYKRAVELLTAAGAEGVDGVLELLDKLEALEGAQSVDLHHARYLAHRKRGDDAAADREREAIRRIDPAYYDALFSVK